MALNNKRRRRVLPRRAPGSPTRHPRWGGRFFVCGTGAFGRLRKQPAGLKRCATAEHGPAKAGHYVLEAAYYKISVNENAKRMVLSGTRVGDELCGRHFAVAARL